MVRPWSYVATRNILPGGEVLKQGLQVVQFGVCVCVWGRPGGVRTHARGAFAHESGRARTHTQFWCARWRMRLSVFMGVEGQLLQ